MNYCTQCRAAGHACYAQEGFDLCVFCEDGVPCTFALAARKNPPLPIPQKPRRERRSSLRVSEIERVVAKQVPAAKPAAEKKENDMSESPQKVCGHAGCGKKLRDSNQSGFCTAHFYHSKRNGERRTCSVAGCSGKLRTDNTTGLCKPHARPRPANGGGARMSASPRKPKTNGCVTPPEQIQDVATIAITEAQLDRQWAKLTIHQKAERLFS